MVTLLQANTGSQEIVAGKLMWNVDCFLPSPPSVVGLTSQIPTENKTPNIFQQLDNDGGGGQSHPGVAAYQFMLEQNVGKTMLQFQVSRSFYRFYIVCSGICM